MVENAAAPSTSERLVLGRIEGTSMMPSLPPGTEVLVLLGNDPPRPGEVAAIRSRSGGWVAHRVMARAKGGYITQGDNRPTPDGVLPQETLAGKAVFARTSRESWTCLSNRPATRIGHRLGRWLVRMAPNLMVACTKAVKMTGKKRFETQQLGTELVVHDTTTGEVHLLNQTAALVWKSLTGGATVSQTVGQICADFPGAAPQEVRADVEAVAQQLRTKLLID